MFIVLRRLAELTTLKRNELCSKDSSWVRQEQTFSNSIYLCLRGSRPAYNSGDIAESIRKTEKTSKCSKGIQ